MLGDGQGVGKVEVGRLSPSRKTEDAVDELQLADEVGEVAGLDDESWTRSLAKARWLAERDIERIERG